MSIAQEVVDRMMVKCARRCCICRRFRPTKLQVHHIVERSNGGSDDEDNLIVVCFTCHSDVHTKVPFARRFSTAELRGHRDALVLLVSNGSLPTIDTDDTDEVIARIVALAKVSNRSDTSLSSEAQEILFKAASQEDGMQGYVQPIDHDGGFSLLAGSVEIRIPDRRAQARYRAGFNRLLQSGLIEHIRDELFEVTDDGYLAADELASTVGQGIE